MLYEKILFPHLQRQSSRFLLAYQPMHNYFSDTLKGQKNGSESTTSWIDVITGKILIYANVIKDERRKPYSNFTGASYKMESQGLRKCLSKRYNINAASKLYLLGRPSTNSKILSFLILSCKDNQ